MIIDLILALVICFLVCLAYRIEPGFIPPTGWLVNWLMSMATLLTFFLLYHIYLRLIAYEAIELTLMVLCYVAFGTYGLYALRKYQLKSRPYRRKKVTWVDIVKWMGIVIGLIAAAVIVVFLGILAME